MNQNQTNAKVDPFRTEVIFESIAMHTNPASKFWIIIQNSLILLTSKNEIFFKENDIAWNQDQILRNFHIDNNQYVVAELNENITLDNKFKVITLRQALSSIDSEHFSILAKAFSIIHWDKSHKFCGRCGNSTFKKENKFERVCKACNVNFFPRISPSIIVLIHNQDNLVMARSPHYAPGIYGLIAGFVETGETIEEAVHREVKEEIGLKIKNLVYKGSQPWPFPDSLMLGFTAEYASGEINIDKNELEHAAWYKYNNLPGRPALQISIASKLLDEFIKSRS